MRNPILDPRTVATRLDDEDDDLFVLDVRNESAYEEWNIDGSHNLPVYDELLEEDYSTLGDRTDELPRDRELAVVCVAGITSANAAEFLRERGFDAQSVDGGMNGWGTLHRSFEVGSVEDVVQVVRPGTGCVSHLVHDGSRALVVDPSQYVDEYLAVADEHDLSIVGVLDTHAHADHVSGARRLAGELDVPYYLHPDDAGSLDGYEPIEDGTVVGVGDRDVDVLHTPGHTPGSVSLRVDDTLLAGDTLFLDSVGRPDLEGSEEADVRSAAGDLYDSLDALGDLPDDTVVLPGHFSEDDRRPLATHLGDLRTDNDLFEYVADDDEESFVETIVSALSDEPANYNEIKAINWGEELPGEDVKSIELGPNNCAAN
jgi:glyoxylase-like metal-dependent hydrolase (beta-lactamase superfamily II)